MRFAARFHTAEFTIYTAMCFRGSGQRRTETSDPGYSEVIEGQRLLAKAAGKAAPDALSRRLLEIIVYRRNYRSGGKLTPR
jgi:hypothetical protein